MHPEDGAGCKIPYSTGVPTGTWQLTSDLTFTIDANGNVGLWAAPLVNFGVVASEASTTAGGAITWSTYAQFGGSATAAALYSSYRVVSGCIKVEYVGNSQTDGGQIVGMWNENSNPGTTATSNASPATNTAAQAFAYSVTLPLRNGMELIWRPKDLDDTNFVTTAQALTYTTPVIGAIVFGGTAGQAVRMRIVFNYEGIATNDTSDFVQRSVTRNDSSQIDQVMNWSQTVLDKASPLFEANSPLRTAANQLFGSMARNAAKNFLGMDKANIGLGPHLRRALNLY